MPSQFNFYKAAYKINQAYGSAKISLANIRMGNDAGTGYEGLGGLLGKGLYADIDSVDANKDLVNIYGGNFANSIASSTHSADYLTNCNFGPAVPKVNDVYKFDWDETCYPSALGDTRDNEKYSNYRDGSWVEAGYDGVRNSINIYTINPASWQEPIWTNTQIVGHSWNPGFPNCRVFTSPSFMGPGGLVYIAYFAWSSTAGGGGGGGPILYYELFGWDPISNLIGSVNGGIDITSSFGGTYYEFPYSGKHDMFHTARWFSTQSYDTCDFLSVLANGSKLIQFNIITGNPDVPVDANAAAYSDVYDVFAYVSNANKKFYTISGRFGLSAPIDEEDVAPIIGNFSLNVFDGDYRPFPTALAAGIQDDYFYFVDDQQAAQNRIVGWSLQIDPSGFFSSAGGLRRQSNQNSSGPFPTPPYTLKRVVVVSPMQLILGSGPNLGGQPLIRVTCGWSGGVWYKGGIAGLYSSSSINEDYIAMFHGICEDYTGYFDLSGQYNFIAAPSYGLPIGAGNGHLLTTGFSMTTTIQNHNLAEISYSDEYIGFAGQHHNYALYLGKAAWMNATYGNAYMYINITGGDSFSNPTSTSGAPAVFIGGSGKLRVISFYTS